ncbi:Regulatory protein SoxS [Roseovarius albus]|uniref:Regulatory protein SoxS n=1 Tax=Roseovarius albus TaxID=1247867 RepID=A0A1X6Z815_9RHOB|nr:AraC family transcriptional regulator [Roseovarius albus]SLN43968.1 Regulatory protein SoxS [Roseovarius albus]
MNKTALQRHRVNRVINFVRDSAAEPMSLDHMADVACLSRYHFSRVFSAHCQETPVEFVSRSRLENSVGELVLKPHRPVTSIALDAGFSGSQAFSHAFRRRFGIGPRGFRDANRGCVVDFPKNQWQQYPMLASTPQATNQAMPSWAASVQFAPEMRLAYIRHIGPYFNMRGTNCNTGGIASSIEQLVCWAKERGVWHKDTTVIGVCPNNPSVTPPQYCQYDVCISVDESVLEDDVVSIQTMPATTYAAVEMLGDSGTLMQAWRWLISHWVPENGLRSNSRTPFEMYQTDGSHVLCPEHGIKLCLPVSTCNESRIFPQR